LLGKDSILKVWRHLQIIGAENGRTYFARKLKAKHHSYRTLDALAARTPEVLAAQARYTPPNRRRRLILTPRQQ